MFVMPYVLKNKESFIMVRQNQDSKVSTPLKHPKNGASNCHLTPDRYNFN